HLAAFRRDGSLLFLAFDLEEPRFQDPHGLCFVLDLAALVLALYDETRGDVCEPHGRIGRVDSLTSRPGGAEPVHAYVLLADAHGHALGFREDGHRRRGGVDSARSLGLRHALDPVNAALVLQARIDAGPLDQSSDRLQAADARVVAVDDFYLPAP